jgi:hypothetical protein
MACPADSCSPAPSTGVCIDCDHVTCDGCDRAIPAADAHRVQWVPGCWAPTALCGACLEDDSDGVPEEIDETETVRERLTTGDVAAYWTMVIENRRAA